MRTKWEVPKHIRKYPCDCSEMEYCNDCRPRKRRRRQRSRSNPTGLSNLSIPTSPQDLINLGLSGLNDTLNMINDMGTLLIEQMDNPRPGLRRDRERKRKCNHCGKKHDHCHHCHGCHDYHDCHDCHHHTHHKHHGHHYPHFDSMSPSADISLDTRIGERRIVSILIENNTSRPCEYDMTLKLLVDSCGRAIEPKRAIVFSPDKGKIPAYECQKVDAIIEIDQGIFEPNQCYYAEICIDADCKKGCTSMAIWTKHDSKIDSLILSDHCRPRVGKFVEISHGSCGCGCCGSPRCLYICNQCYHKDSDSNPDELQKEKG